MDFDTLTLSRIQFAMTIMFHYLFPPLSIGLGVLMVFMEGMYLRTKDPQYQAMTKFWTGIFAVNFAVGVATGIVMEFQFGTNWARFSRYVGDIFGSALAAEGIFAFFLESGFLAVLVFGWDRVSPRMHFFATCMVALGSTFSAVWIVIANSWMHTPAGYRLENAGLPEERVVIESFWAMVFNPSSMDRLLHVILAAFLLGAFFVMSVTAYYILRGRHVEFARKAFTIALIWGFINIIAMMASGHTQAKKLATTQPAKLAAFEGHFKTGTGGTGMYLMGWPDIEAEEIRYGIEAPYALSIGVYFDEYNPIKSIREEVWNKPVRGLDQFPEDVRPPVFIPFLTYHAMVVAGVFMLVLLTYAMWLWWRGLLFERRWLMVVFVFAVLAAYIGNQAGWVAAEVGRQPFIVYGEVKEIGPNQMTIEGGLRTGQGYSHRVAPSQVLASTIMFSLVYILLFVVWVYVLNSKISKGPEAVHAPSTTRPVDILDVAAGRVGGELSMLDDETSTPQGGN